VIGKGRQTAAEAIFCLLDQYFKVKKFEKESPNILDVYKKEILIFETDLIRPQVVKNLQFLIRKSQLPILLTTHIGDIPPDRDFFTGERKDIAQSKKIVKILPSQGYLILNYDDETVREIKDSNPPKDGASRGAGKPRVPTAPSHILTFGFQEGADFRATDVKLNSGTNFKINYKGNIVPIWLEKLFGKEQIYSALSAAAIAMIFDLNLVETSKALKNYQSLPGRMKLIEGINKSFLLDDSNSATVFSMAEAIEILGKTQDFKRKIAVLGDVLNIGQYTIEAHESIGERVAKNADLLFTFGQRAKFIAQGSQIKGMAIEKIFQFDTIEEGKNRLKEEIKEGDLILVDGSKEMEMGEIVKEIGAV